MSIAVLPFNAGPETRPALARQFANFAAEIVRARTGADVHSVNVLVRVDDSNPPRLANVNPAETLNDPQMLNQLFQQTPARVAVDGLLVETQGDFELTVRVFGAGEAEPTSTETFTFGTDGVLKTMRSLVEEIAARAEVILPEETSGDENLFGTTKPEAFLSFLEGYDTLNYIDKTQGQVVADFDPQSGIDLLLQAIESDPDWDAPMGVLMQLARACLQIRAGDPQKLMDALDRAAATDLEDVRPYIVKAEIQQGLNQLAEAVETLEHALTLSPEESAIYTRLGIAQQGLGLMGMAEESFKKAVEMEGDDKPTMPFLAQLLSNTERVNEVPDLWRKVLETSPDNSQAWAQLGTSLFQTENRAEGLRIFDEGVEKAADPLFVKRFYAPALASVQEWDKAMDLYEECLEIAPADIQLLLEYAQTLQGAGRQFEVPRVLRDVLGANPDANTRAQALAWLVELEQPKRVETVVQAREKFDAEDFQGVVKTLRPMRNWLADYFRMWELYAAALNRIGEHREAEEASTRLIELFPGNELGWAELANAFAPQNKHNECYNAMVQGLRMMPNSLPIAINLGLAARRIGRNHEAEMMAAQIRQVVQDPKELAPILAEMEGKSAEA